MLKGAGTGNTPMAFLFSDTQIINESFVEDINNMLNSGEVPNIFPNDERVAICEVRAGNTELHICASCFFNSNRVSNARRRRLCLIEELLGS